MKPLLVYITTKNENEAKKIAEHVIRKKLASCANIIPGMKSIYKWKGKMVKDNEALLILKTFDNRYSKLEKEVKKIHSYTVPCIIALPIQKGNKEYLQWSKKQST